MSKPKEDPSDRAARRRERRIAEVERMAAGESNAAGLAADLRAVYGNLKASPKMPGMKAGVK